jgi:hypothetical protein
MGIAEEEQGVEGQLAGAEDEDEESGEENGVRGGGGEFVGIGDDGEEGFAIGGDVGHEHVDGEDKADETREEANGEQQTADELDGGNEGGGEAGSGETEAREEFGDVSEIVELAPAVLGELQAPVDADEQKERRLQRAGGADGPGVETADGGEEVHRCGAPVGRK